MVGYTVTTVPASAGCAQTTATSCVITGLTPGIAYAVSVTFQTTSGTTTSIAATGTPADAPVLAVTGADSLRFAVAGLVVLGPGVSLFARSRRRRVTFVA